MTAHPKPNAILLAFCALALSACGTYDPPKPGIHRGPGEPPADVTCSYETPTASRFVQLRCIRTEELKDHGENARREIDGIRTPAPVIK